MGNHKRRVILGRIRLGVNAEGLDLGLHRRTFADGI